MSPQLKQKKIWKYLNAANLIKIENFNDKSKLKELEQAVNKGQVDEDIILIFIKTYLLI